MHSPLDEDIAAVSAAYADRGLPEWHVLSVEAARALEDELLDSNCDTCEPHIPYS